MKLMLLCLSVLMLVGCASSQRSATTQAGAKCLVCVKNADLACVDVAVDANTPRYAFGGQTYYFCSEECRAKFAKDPGKYAR